METTQTTALSFIEMLKSQIAEIDSSIGPMLEKRKTKAALANATAADAGLQLPFPDADATTLSINTPPPSDIVQPDQYTGKKMATACREIMQRRKARGLGPIQIEELYTQLKTGGYAFRAIGKDNGITSLSTTLGKNGQFRRVPGSASLWGLAEWYGAAQTRRKAAGGAADDQDDEESETPPESPAATMPPAK
jgi:hypothetical protein